MKIELVPGAAGAPLVQPLEALVYTPEYLKTWVGRNVQWAHADQRAIVRTDAGEIVSHAGAFVREAEWDGLPVTLGGIGGVVTHPAHRRQGYARAALKRALTWLHDEPAVAFALLFCEPHNIAYYADQGWQGFEGTVLVRQSSGVAPFTLFHAMTLAVRKRNALRGTLDLRGEPW
jgi:GNAT superfamily N-acetyltransferase